MSSTLLFVLTSHHRLDGSGIRTGFHFAEMAISYYLLQDANIPVVLTSIEGGTPHPDPASIDNRDIRNNPDAVRRFLNDIEAMYKLENTMPLEAYSLQNFSGVFFVGGQGALWDFPHSAPVQRLITQAYSQDKVIAAIGHGSAALVDVVVNNDFIVNGHSLSVYPDAEQRAMGTDRLIPFLLESRLREQGANIINSDTGRPVCIEDKPFLTAPNAASSAVLGKKLRECVLGQASVAEARI